MLNREKEEKKRSNKRKQKQKVEIKHFRLFWQESYMETETFIRETQEKKSYEI